MPKGMSDYEVIDAMITYGGSFVKQLGLAFRAADSINRAKLHAAFPEYWNEYDELASSRPPRTLTDCTCGADMVPGRADREHHSHGCPRRRGSHSGPTGDTL